MLITHLPAGYLMTRAARMRAAALFLIAVLGHLILDSFAGGIMWLWPLRDHLYSLSSVPATQTHWVLSFMLHWSFLPELAITGAALWLFLTRKSIA